MIAEDDALLREGLVLLFGSEGIEVAAAHDFLAAVAEHQPTRRSSTYD